jgi:hypothetical protein
MSKSSYILALALLLASAPAALAGLGGEAMELEAARANARAGGPLNDRDKELLERYGCLSGTKSEFCEKLNRTMPSTTPSSQRKKH